MSAALTNAAYVQIGRKQWPFVGLAETSAMFCAARDKSGNGASRTPKCLVVDANGNTVAHVSYNGRVWAGNGNDWTPDTTPLYCNRAAQVSA